MSAIRITSAMLLVLAAGGWSPSASAARGDDETQKMVKDMSAAVNNLNQTTAGMLVRMDETDRSLRELKSLTEENQAKLNQLQSSLDQLTATIYQQFGLTPPRSTSVAPPPASTVYVAPEPGTVYVAPEPSTIESGQIIVQPPPVSGDTMSAPATMSTSGVDASYNEAQQMYGTGNYEGALLKFSEHLRMYPQSPHASNAQYWKAHCHFKLNNYQSAIEEFERLRSNYPTSNKVPTAMHNEAVAYSRLGQSARAEALFRRLVVEYPDDAAAESAREKLRQMQGLEQ